MEASLALAAAAIVQSQLMAGDRSKFHCDKKTNKKQLDSFQCHIQSATSGFSRRFDSHDRGNLGVPPTSIDQSAESNSYSILLHSGKLIVPAWGESKVSPGRVRFFLCFFFSKFDANGLGQSEGRMTPIRRHSGWRSQKNDNDNNNNNK